MNGRSSQKICGYLLFKLLMGWISTMRFRKIERDRMLMGIDATGWCAVKFREINCWDRENDRQRFWQSEPTGGLQEWLVTYPDNVATDIFTVLT